MNLYESNHTVGWAIDEVFDAALQTLINDRCRHAYIHDIRGPMQAVHSAFELLAKSAKHGAGSGAVIDNALALAKRAIASHERVALEIVHQLTAPQEAPVIVNVAHLLEEIQLFLRNDAACRDIRMFISGSKDVLVSAVRYKLRTLLLALLALCIDALPAGAELNIDVGRAADEVCVELRSELPFDEIRGVAELLRDPESAVQPRDLILGGAQHWLEKHGGRFVLDADAAAPNALRIYYPIKTA